MNINTILDQYDPDALAKLTDPELIELLKPYIPASRQAVMPEERVKKEGVAVKYVKSMLANLSPTQLEELTKANNL